MRAWILVVAGALGLAAVAPACSSTANDGGRLPVTSETLDDSQRLAVRVFEPDADGQWPVIVLLHGVDGEASDMAELATHLAARGYVVFAPTYRTDMTTEQGVFDAATDVECAYRFGRSVAAGHGGDLDRPVTLVGWSLGASAALAIGMTADLPIGPCFDEAPRPDVIVAISGCHYEGGSLDLVDTDAWANDAARIELIAGADDTECLAWESEDAAAEIRAAGYRVELATLDGADHFSPMFHELVDGEMVVRPDDPIGERTVGMIVDAIGSADG